jgi:hypothetical protein
MITLLSMGGSKFLHAQLRGQGDEGDDATAEPTDDAPFMQQPGVAAWPVVTRTLRALGYRHGDEVWLLKVWDKAIALAGLAAGETRLYGMKEPTACVKILPSGDIEITPKAGRYVVLKEGTLKAARVTDPIRIGTIAVAGGGGVTVSFTPVDADGIPGVPTAPGPTAIISGVVSNAGGNDRVLA